MDPTTTMAAALGGAALLAAIGWTRLGAGRRWRARPLRAREALGRAARLVELVGHVQQHRGMSGAWLAGDASFAAHLPEKQAAVERAFAALLEAMAGEDAEPYPCFVSNDLRLLRHRWRELVAGLGGSSPEHSFQAHCRVVATLLEWLAALGEARIEQPFAGEVSAAAARNFAHRLPVLAECLGQARALGSAVAVRRYCPPVARVRLAFLAARSETLLRQATEATADRGAAACAQARHGVDAYLEAIRGRLLAAREIDMPAGDYFALATRAMDAVFAWLEAEQGTVAAALGAGVVAGPAAPEAHA